MKKPRDRTGLTVAEGPLCVDSALQNGIGMKYVIVSRAYSQSEGFLRVKELLAAKEAASEHQASPLLWIVDDSVFNRMAGTKTPQGILCVLPWPWKYLAGGPKPVWQKPLQLCCIDIQDPGNAGVLIRAAAAAGASKCSFLGASADVFSPKCIRASAGAVFTVRVEQDSLAAPTAFLAELEGNGLTVYKAVPRGGDAPWEADFLSPAAIVVGNEASGLSPEVLAGPGRKLTIPMPGATESLNVASASAMILYEAVRQRMEAPICR